MAKNSAARIAANNRYTEKTYDRFTFRVRKEDADAIKAAAAAAGETLNSFIYNAVRQRVNNGK